jgi:ribosomal protein S18 acetylase RimI-like enzyme
MIETRAAPSGVAIRGYRGEEDLPALHRVWNAAAEANGVEEVKTVEDFHRDYASLVNCDLARDCFIAEVDGEVVAYARVFWQELVDGGRSYENFGFVHPAWRRRGIGSALHRIAEERLLEIAATHSDVAEKWLASESVDADAGSVALLRHDGYQAARFFYDMVARTLDGIAVSAMPDGIEARPVVREHYRAIWEASAEAFRDHWGENEWTDSEWAQFEADPRNADPRYWRVAWDGDQVAGSVITTVPADANERFGRARVYVSMVSVRRPWRRRGLARALLASSLAGAREGGFTSASLGVDTDSPTGATDLYRSLGFVPERTFTAWRKPL